MAKVSNLSVKQITASDDLVVTWDFKSFSKTVTKHVSGGVNAGDLVTIKSGATWYNGASIPSWVMNDSWYVLEVRGDRAVLNRNPSGTNAIMSPINVNYLNGGSSGGTTTETTNYGADTVDHYTYYWTYQTGDNVAFWGSQATDVTDKYFTLSPPSNAVNIDITVMPISKTYQVNGQDTQYWSGEKTTIKYNMYSYRPETPSEPEVSIKDRELTMTIDNISDAHTDVINFLVYKDTVFYKSVKATVAAAKASAKLTVDLGHLYRICAQAINTIGGSITSTNNSGYVSIETVPSAPQAIVQIRAQSTTSIYLEWSPVTTAKTYIIEYATKLEYFDQTDQTSTVSNITNTHYILEGLETGHDYFLRVSAANDQGQSKWTDIKSVVLGKKPSAPTTWSSTTTAIVGEKLYLYWVHNAEDNSSETYANVWLSYDNGATYETKTIKNTANEDEKDKIKQYEINTSSMVEGVTILWKVQTSGVTNEFGDWSVTREINVYSKPTLSLELTDVNDQNFDVLTTFPFKVKATTGPATQNPIGYTISVTANTGYETTDNVGKVKYINAGETIFNQYIIAEEGVALDLTMTPGLIDLESGIGYTVYGIVAMDSGLTAESSIDFTVRWTEAKYDLDAEISIDDQTYTAYVTPYCVARTDGQETPDVTLAVYRKQFDGSFILISGDIDPTANTCVLDPHPALDYARYRIVAVENSTGGISYYDPPAYPVGGLGAVIQWNEEWSDFDISTTTEMADSQYNGSFLNLKYNLDVNDQTSPDVDLVNYIGRKNPVSYYGTAIGMTSSWNLVIPKEDMETLYALRRLQQWTGDCYIRENSGSGYWANVKVSFSQTHAELTTPVSLSITRVEGGV